MQAVHRCPRNILAHNTHKMLTGEVDMESHHGGGKSVQEDLCQVEARGDSVGDYGAKILWDVQIQTCKLTKGNWTGIVGMDKAENNAVVIGIPRAEIGNKEAD